jgi:hypothetical protein
LPNTASAPYFPSAVAPFQYTSSGAASAPVLGSDDKIDSLVKTQSEILKLLQEMQLRMKERDESAAQRMGRNRTSKNDKKPVKKLVPEPVIADDADQTYADQTYADQTADESTDQTANQTANQTFSDVPAAEEEPMANMSANNMGEAQEGGRRKTPRKKRKGRASRKA